MKPPRPVARDHSVGDRLARSGWPIVASRETPPDRTSTQRTAVTHSYAAVAFYTGGHARVDLRRSHASTRKENGEWSLREGDVLLVPAGHPHRMLEMKRSEYWGLAFCMPCFAIDGAASLLQPLERVRDGASAVVHIPTERHSFLEGLFRELQEVGSRARGPSEALAAVQRSLLTLILAEVDRAGASADRSEVGGGVVVESLRFIERNCLRRVTLDEIAAAVHRTPTYVTAALTQATGRSAGEWITSGRMAEARRLLLHSDERIDVIAERVGYADATHFIRMFRREHGETPAAWRSKQAKASR